MSGFEIKLASGLWLINNWEGDASEEPHELVAIILICFGDATLGEPEHGENE